MLDLDHGSLARTVRRVELLGHDAVEPGALEAAEPVFSERAILRGRRKVHRRHGSIEGPLETFPPSRQRRLAQVLVAECEQVPGDVRGRGLLGQKLHSRLGRVDAQQQRLEVEPVRTDDHNLAVDDAALRQGGEERLDELREIAVHWPAVPALEHDFVAVPEDQRAEAVPLGLELPALAGGQFVCGPGQHWGERRIEG